MSSPSRPTLRDVTDALGRLADRITTSQSPAFEPFITATLGRALEEFENYIPGLDPPPQPQAAESFRRAAAAAFKRGDARDALAYAVRGLACSPHDPNLTYLASSAAFELGGVEISLRLLYHTLWLYPAHAAARADLDALTAFLDEQAEDDDEEDRAA